MRREQSRVGYEGEYGLGGGGFFINQHVVSTERLGDLTLKYSCQSTPTPNPVIVLGSNIPEEIAVNMSGGGLFINHPDSITRDYLPLDVEESLPITPT